MPTRPERRYDIEADWVLLSRCTFRCPYCFFDPALLSRPAKSVPPEQLARFFDGTGWTWMLHLTGGEPFLYPDFVELCRLLASRHYISLNTNCQSAAVRDFVRLVKPDRVGFMNCGMHLTYRRERVGTERFVENFRLLRQSGFPAFASCVMSPELFPTFRGEWQRFADAGVVLIPKSLQGKYRGRLYPEAYSDEERGVFREFHGLAERHYRAEFASKPEPPTVNPLLDVELFLSAGSPDYRGRLCGAGQEFVRIREDGTIRRCGAGDVLGNVADGLFLRRSGPSICTETECPYFCVKYAQ